MEVANIGKPVKARAMAIATALSVMSCSVGTAIFISASNNAVYADALSNAAKSASSGLQSSIKGALPYLIILVLVVAGLAFLGLGGQHAKERQKETAWEKILGIAFIASAPAIATLIFGWFS